jgi:hypothetical protein
LAEKLNELQADIFARLQFQAGAVNMRHRLEFGFDIEFEESLRSNLRLGFKVAGLAIGVVGFVLGIAAWPVGLLAVAIGFVPAIIDHFSPNREDRRRKARNDLESKLLEMLKSPRSQVLGQFQDILSQARDQVSDALQQSLGGSRLALLTFHDQLQKTQTDLQQQAQRLS